jgi:hypothetical protein
MQTAELKVELPVEDIEFLQSYANQHGAAISDVVARLVKGLHQPSRRPVHPEVRKLTGLIPPEVDAKEAYIQHLVEKHR